MNTFRLTPQAVFSWIAPLLIFAACDGNGHPKTRGDVSISVAPLTLKGVSDACYDIAVKNGRGEQLWVQKGLCSSSYGAGGGDISYVGTCDASANPNTVSLVLSSLVDSAGRPITDANNPCPPDAPCAQTVTCVENADTQVEFNLTILRSAQTGFFDVAVNLDEIFCSAKFDCAKDGQPIMLLQDPATGQRVPSSVLAFSCTGGDQQALSLLMSEVDIECKGSAGAFTTSLDPGAGPGNFFDGATPAPRSLVQAAAYRTAGSALLNDVGTPSASWSVAFALNQPGLAELGATNCRVMARATAVKGALASANGWTPPSTSYPYVNVDVPLTAIGANGGSVPVCSSHPLDADGSGVTTAYTGIEKARLSRTFAVSPQGN